MDYAQGLKEIIAASKKPSLRFYNSMYATKEIGFAQLERPEQQAKCIRYLENLIEKKESFYQKRIKEYEDMLKDSQKDLRLRHEQYNELDISYNRVIKKVNETRDMIEEVNRKINDSNIKKEELDLIKEYAQAGVINNTIDVCLNRPEFNVFKKVAGLAYKGYGSLCQTCSIRFFFSLSNYQTGVESKSRRGFVYFVQVNNFIKVGLSRIQNPFERIKTYKTENPDKLKLVALIETYNCNILESKFHSLFTEKGYHHNREWFTMDVVTLKKLLKESAKDPGIKKFYQNNQTIFMTEWTYSWFNKDNLKKCCHIKAGLAYKKTVYSKHQEDFTTSYMKKKSF